MRVGIQRVSRTGSRLVLRQGERQADSNVLRTAMYRFLLLTGLGLVSCAAPPRTPYPKPGKTVQVCTIQSRDGRLLVSGTSKSARGVTKFSFTVPDKDVVLAGEISDYTQETKYKRGGGWSGGSPSGGFIFRNTSYPPYFLEFHLLQRSACNCRHVEPYFGNGRYSIQGGRSMAGRAGEGR